MTNSISTGVAFSDPALSGATIDNSVIGGTTKAAGSFTNITASGNAAITGNATITGNASLGSAASSYLAFYNGTLSTQPTSGNQAAVNTVAAITAAGSYGFNTAAQANGIITLLNQLRSDFVTLGLIKGS